MGEALALLQTVQGSASLARSDGRNPDMGQWFGAFEVGIGGDYGFVSSLRFSRVRIPVKAPLTRFSCKRGIAMRAFSREGADS